MIMTIITLIMEHECEKETFWGINEGEEERKGN
jgi:hypothetical protein